jgi:hypothetical protein
MNPERKGLASRLWSSEACGASTGTANPWEVMVCGPRMGATGVRGLNCRLVRPNPTWTGVRQVVKRALLSCEIGQYGGFVTVMEDGFVAKVGIGGDVCQRMLGAAAAALWANLEEVGRR